MSIGNQSVALVADPEALTTRLERSECLASARPARRRWRRPEWATRSLPGRCARRRASRLYRERRPHPRGEAGRLRHRRSMPEPATARSALLHPARGRRAERAGRPRGLRPLARPSPAGLPWLVDERNAGALDIVWVDHTSPTRTRQASDAFNYLLTRGVDAEREILDTERLIIAEGETPSLFFRFPGLVSSDPLMQRSAGSIW